METIEENHERYDNILKVAINQTVSILLTTNTNVFIAPEGVVLGNQVIIISISYSAICRPHTTTSIGEKKKPRQK